MKDFPSTFFSWFTRQLPLWIIVDGLIAYCYPPFFTWITKEGINWFFALTMVAVGLTMEAADFLPAFKRPHWILLGNLTQFAVMPTLGFAIGKLLNFPPLIFVGFVLVGTVPGAMASNVISFLAGADVAYSVLMTTFATMLAPLLTPALTKLLAGKTVAVPFLKMCWQISWMVVLPLLVGVGLRYYYNNKVKKMESFCSALAALAIIVICAYIIAMNKGRFAELTGLIVLGIVLMNGLGMMAGYGVGRLYGFDMKRRRTLSFEVGMQNAGLGAVLAINNFAPETALPPALFATWCVITASFIARIWARVTSGSVRSIL